MDNTSVFNDLDSAVLTAISHGQIETLLKAEVTPEHLDHPDARAILRAATDAHHARQPINGLSLLTATWGQLTSPADVKALFSLNGTGEVNPKNVAEQVKTRHLLRQAEGLAQKAVGLAKSRPSEVRQWLPAVMQQMETLVHQGRVYDPRPSAHQGEIIGPVMFKSNLPTLNKIFEGRTNDGGGYRKAWYDVWIGVSGHGKTTLAYMKVNDIVRSNRRVAILSTENQKQVKARVLWGLTHLTMKEINQHKAIAQIPDLINDIIINDSAGNPIGKWHEASVRQYMLESWEKHIEPLLLLYDWSFFSKSELKGIIRADAPDVILCDYVSEEDGIRVGPDSRTGLGRISRVLEDLAHDNGINIHAYYQMANSEKDAYLKDDHHIVSGPYGSGAVVHHADQCIQTKRDRLPLRQHLLVTKDRASRPNVEYWLGYDDKRWIYTELSEPREPQEI